ncbi:hypothetical protein PORY_001761, partial [Pneumocystis oryctolagi]
IYMSFQEKSQGKPLEEDPLRLNSSPASNNVVKQSINVFLDNEIKPEIQTQVHRLLPGTKKEVRCIIYNIPAVPVMPLDFSEPFSLEMYLSGLIAKETSHPISIKTAKEIAEAPPNVDPWLWVYELVRRLTIDLNVLIVGMLEDSCSSEKCPEMRMNEWQYLCACHNPPQECAAIDYILHTLDNATTLLCSNKYFPSKMSVPVSSTRHFSSIMRRLYRIFSHAWCKHHDVFWKVENETSLYRRFMAVSEHYHFKYEHSSMIDEAYSKKIKDCDYSENKGYTVDYSSKKHSSNYNDYQTSSYLDDQDNKENLGNRSAFLSP